LTSPYAVVPALAERPRDHTDDFVFAFEDRPLLDMRLEVRVDRTLADGSAPGVADAVQRLAERDSVDVALRKKIVEREDVGKGAGSAHGRDEPRAFLVGPDRHTHRLFGRDTGFVQGAQHFQSGEHAVVAVELSAGGLRIDVTSGQDHRRFGVATPSNGEDV